MSDFPWDYERVFRELQRIGMLEPVLALLAERRAGEEKELRAELIEGELFEVDGKLRASLYRLQGRVSALGEILTVMKTLARPPAPAETEPE